MGGGASSQAAFEQMLACTMILGEAMVQGLDPRYVRFPDMYRLYDFHVGPKKHQQRSFQGNQMVLFVRAAPDDDDDSGGGGAMQRLTLVDPKQPQPKAKSAMITKEDDEDEDGPNESNVDFLVVYVSGDKIVLDKATLNQPNNDGWTPLHACCHTLNAQEAGIAILKELIDRKADLNLVTKRGPGSFSCGWTPLHIATAYGLEALALKLIRAGAEVNTKNTVGWTPLYDACHRGYASLTRELLKAGARHDLICPEFALCPYPGQYALAEAARQGHVETVKVLLEWGVNKNATNSLGWTALHEASYHNRLAVVKLLIVYGADVLIKTNKGSLARDVTISSEIRAMLEDLTKERAPSSPKKAAVEGEEAESRGEAKGKAADSPKRSPTKAQSERALPLSRKEEYAMLGDLPSLDKRHAAPAISIQDVDEDAGVEQADESGAADDGEDDDDDERRHAKKHKSKKKKSKRHDQREIPTEFKCAVSLKLMRDPLRSPLGHVFERKVMEAWFRDFGNRCPLTGQPLAMTQLVADDKLKAEIKAWKHGKGEERKVVAEESTDVDAKPVATMPTTAPVDDVDPYDF